MSEQPPADQDADFRTLMADVTPLRRQPSRPRVNRPIRKDKGRDYQRQMASQEQTALVDGLSREAVEIVESEQELLFAAPGLQLSQLKKLRRGHIPWQAGIDLHGQTIDQARDSLSLFIRDCQQQRLRVVLVVHGKAYSEAGQQALLKSYVNDWLRQLPVVVAFCSAQPKDGGSGAVYVLLRQPKH